MSGEVATVVTLLGLGLVAVIGDLGYDVIVKARERRRQRNVRP